MVVSQSGALRSSPAFAGAECLLTNRREVLVVRVLGNVRFEWNGAPWVVRAPVKAIELLGYLVMHDGAPLQRDRLASLLWPDDDENEARTKLRRHFHMLSSALPAADIPYTLNTRHTARWNGDAKAVVDVIRFQDACARGDHAEATEWYGGDFLESHYEDWVLVERERLRNLQLDNLRESIRRKRSERDLAGALADVGRIFSIDQWREDTLRTEMSIRADLGDRGGALAAYRTFEKRLRDELDVDPLPETRAVFERLLRGEDPAGDDMPLRARRTDRETAALTLPFGGRSTEMRVLMETWDAAADGRGRMVLIGGEAGSGKSRLAAELALRAESQGGRIYRGTTSPGETRPYEALVEALREALPVILATVRDSSLLGAIASVVPEISAHAAIDSPPTLGAEAERLRFYEAIVSVLVSLGRRHPLVIVVEDLHWAGAASLGLLEFVVRRITARPILIVGTYREDEVGRAHGLRTMRRRLEDEGSLSNVALDRLVEGEVLDIAGRIFGDRPDLPQLAEQLFARSEGVPLFLEEVVRNPNGIADTERLNAPARIERLNDEERTMLDVAAVAGSGFTVELVREASGWPEADVLRALDGLVAARFLREPRRKTRSDYVFSHHLLLDAVYQRVAPNERRRRHAATARVLSELETAAVPERAGEIARHWRLGGQNEDAAREYARAARHAEKTFANEEALALADAALECSAADEHAAWMHLLRVRLAFVLSRPDLAEDAIAQLAPLTKSLEQALEYEMRRSEHSHFRRRFDICTEAAQAALEAVAGTDNRDHQAGALFSAASSAMHRGEYDAARAYLTRAFATMRPDMEKAELQRTRVSSSFAFAFRRFAEGRATAEILLEEARREGDVDLEAEALMRLAVPDVEFGKVDEAEEELARAETLYERMSMHRGRVWVGEIRGRIAQRRAQYDLADSLYEEAARFYRAVGQEWSLVRVLNMRALANLCGGNTALAIERLDAEIELVANDKDYWSAEWRMMRGIASGLVGDYAASRSTLGRAIADLRALAESSTYAYVLSFAAFFAASFDDAPRARDLRGQLETVAQANLEGADFPHMLDYAKSAAALADGDEPAARAYRASALAHYEARILPLSAGQRTAYAAVPWNARFLTESL